MPSPPGNAPGPLGLAPNVAALLGYLPSCLCLIGLVLSIVFFFVEKNNRFVRFHALQAAILHVIFLVIGIANYILGIILAAALGNTGSLINLVLSVGILLVEIGLFGFLMFKAYGNEQMKLPLIGDFAEKTA